MKDQQTFRETQRKIDQLQEKINHLQVKPLFSVTLSDKGTAVVTESGSLVISKGSKFKYCGYLLEHYDLRGDFCYRFIVDDSLTAESILVAPEQDLKAFIKKLGDFFAKYEGYNTDYTYNNYLSRLNSRLNRNTGIDFKALDANLKLMKKLKAAGFNVTYF